MISHAEATAILDRADVNPRADFFELSGAEVGELLKAAKRRGYRQPANANGSRARYFFAALQRAIRRGSL